MSGAITEKLTLQFLALHPETIINQRLDPGGIYSSDNLLETITYVGSTRVVFLFSLISHIQP